MDGALAGALSHLRQPARGAVSGVDSRPGDEQQRRRIRRTAILLALTALGIYVAFIASGIMKATP